MNTIDYTKLGVIGAEAAYQAAKTAGKKSAWLMAVHDGLEGTQIGFAAFRGDEPARTAYAEAVVRAYLEQVGEGFPIVGDCLQAMSTSPTTGQAIEAIRRLMLAAFARKMQAVEKELGEEVKEACATVAKQCAEIGRLMVELGQAQAMVGVYKGYGEDIKTQITPLQQRNHELNELLAEAVAKLATVTAERDRMQWRPVSEKPTRQDADASGNVESITPKGRILLRMFSSWPWELNHTTAHEVTHWRPFCPPPAPSAEDAERERFEIWAATSSFGHDLTRTPCRKHYNSALTSEAWELWQAARAVKEGEK